MATATARACFNECVIVITDSGVVDESEQPC